MIIIDGDGPASSGNRCTGSRLIEPEIILIGKVNHRYAQGYVTSGGHSDLQF